MATVTASVNVQGAVATTTGGGLCPRWLHVVAVLAALAALPLLFLGAEVTTKGVGMADHRPVVNPLAALWEMSTGQQALGWRIEHSHRLAGWLVGLLATVLAVGLGLTAPRLRWVGVLAWALVSIQGSLGIFRVGLNAWFGSGLALVHGAFAPIVFATLVAAALSTSRRWTVATPVVAPRLRRWAGVVVGLVFVQLVLGGMLRHQGWLLAARLHLLGAFLALGGILWLVKAAWDEAALRTPARLLLGLVALQALLGVEAWMAWMKRAYVPLADVQESMAMHWVRSGHYVLGTLIFATAVSLLLLAWRRRANAGGEATP